jgi:hypothetical protein
LDFHFLRLGLLFIGLGFSLAASAFFKGADTGLIRQKAF